MMAFRLRAEKWVGGGSVIPKSLYRNDWDGVIGDYKAEYAVGPGFSGSKNA